MPAQTDKEQKTVRENRRKKSERMKRVAVGIYDDDDNDRRTNKTIERTNSSIEGEKSVALTHTPKKTKEMKICDPIIFS